MAETEESHRSSSTRREGSAGPGSGPDLGSKHIDLDLPADPSVLSLVRLTVGVVAARADLGLEDVDDLRLAVEELFLSLWRSTASKPERLQFGFIWDERGVEVRCSFVMGDGATSTEPVVSSEDSGDDESMAGLPAELSQQILDALVDDHRVDTSDSTASGWVRKDRAAAVE